MWRKNHTNHFYDFFNPLWKSWKAEKKKKNIGLGVTFLHSPFSHSSSILVMVSIHCSRLGDSTSPHFFELAPLLFTEKFDHVSYLLFRKWISLRISENMSRVFHIILPIIVCNFCVGLWISIFLFTHSVLNLWCRADIILISFVRTDNNIAHIINFFCGIYLDFSVKLLLINIIFIFHIPKTLQPPNPSLTPCCDSLVTQLN